MKKKIAFIVQRYGLEVNGGAEYHCRVIAERLKDLYDVEVLTSCAKDYLSWKNEYPAGMTNINGIKVNRFAVDKPRNWNKFHSIGRLLNKRKLHQKILRFFGLLAAFEKTKSPEVTRVNEENWIRYQGPYLPNLVSYLAANQSNYEALIFFTYLYYPTFEGIKIAPQKSILVPTAHDEPPIYMGIFQPFFKTPAAILYNTESERRFVNKLFNNADIYSDTVGLGVETSHGFNPVSIKDVIDEKSDFLIYIGRIDISKGCKILFEYFLTYKNTVKSNLKLVMVGEVFMEMPVNKDVIVTGFVDQDMKTSLLLKAKALVIPSFYESLSLVTLESMACGIPVIANQKCEVLKDHIENSHAGFLFDDYESFKLAVDIISSADCDKTAMSANAKKYVAENYTWEMTIQKYQQAIDHVSHH